MPAFAGAKEGAVCIGCHSRMNKLTAAPMDEKLEWTYFELWHHEG